MAISSLKWNYSIQKDRWIILLSQSYPAAAAGHEGAPVVCAWAEAAAAVEAAEFGLLCLSSAELEAWNEDEVEAPGHGNSVSLVWKDELRRAWKHLTEAFNPTSTRWAL